MEGDSKYVVALKNGDGKAFDLLFRKYTERIYAFTLGITRQRFAAEEITQIVFLKVWENRYRIDEHFSFKSFLFSVAYREIISWLRKEKSEKRKIEGFTSSFNDISEDTEVRIEFRNLETITGTIIDSFPPKRKEIFRLSRENGLTNKEIAQELDISVKTVEGHMTAALKILRERVGHSELGACLYFSIFVEGTERNVPDKESA